MLERKERTVLLCFREEGGSAVAVVGGAESQMIVVTVAGASKFVFKK